MQNITELFLVGTVKVLGLVPTLTRILSYIFDLRIYVIIFYSLYLFFYFYILGAATDKGINDILYILDGSQGVSEKEFNDVKFFIMRQLALYEVVPRKTRVGFVVIGNDKQYLAPTGDLNVVKATLRGLKMGGGTRRVDQTLYFMQEKLGDFRQINNKIAVMFLHGSNSREGKANLFNAAKVLFGMNVLLH